MIYILSFGDPKTLKIPLIYSFHGVKYKIITPKDLDSFKQKTNISGLIIGGKGFYFTEENIKYYREIFEFLKFVTYPVLGVCFGH